MMLRRHKRENEKRSGAMRPLKISRLVLDEIQRSVGSCAPETGGMLGGNRDLGVVTHFHFDDQAHRTRAAYSPDCQTLNRVLTEEWNPAGVRLMGFVHSHPRWVRRPSGGDEVYAQRILTAIPEMDRLLLPIVMAEPDNGHFEMLPFAATRHGKGVAVDDLQLLVSDSGVQGEPLARFREMAMFARVRAAYDLDQLQRARVVVVGCGGAAEFVEWMARAGVGEFVLIDPDTVAEANLATQHVYRRDVGRPKVDCVAERLKDVNPHVRVMALHVSSDDLSDGDFGHLLRDPLNGSSSAVTLLCGLTDSFEAQARLNLLALQFGVASLCAQVYAEGFGAEVTFTHEKTTPACHRCVLNRRYRAYRQEGFRNNVTSDGSPIGSTGRLNALTFFVAMALLHHGTDHPRWGRIASRIGDRSLVQLRMHPDLDLPVFDRVFGMADRTRIFCDDTVWLPQRPDHPDHGYPACPDCGGTGDLRTAVGTIADTRVMTSEPCGNS